MPKCLLSSLAVLQRQGTDVGPTAFLVDKTHVDTFHTLRLYVEKSSVTWQDVARRMHDDRRDRVNNVCGAGMCRVQGLLLDCGIPTSILIAKHITASTDALESTKRRPRQSRRPGPKINRADRKAPECQRPTAHVPGLNMNSLRSRTAKANKKKA